MSEAMSFEEAFRRQRDEPYSVVREWQEYLAEVRKIEKEQGLEEGSLDQVFRGVRKELVMDQSGHWHQGGEDAIDAAADVAEPGFKGTRQRVVISCEVGSMVHIENVDCDGPRSSALCRFEGAEKNRVMLTVMGSNPPYFEIGSNVRMVTGDGQACRAQVWDNQKGKLILRTLPQ